MQFRPPMHAMPAFSRPPFMTGSLAMPPGLPPQHLMRPPLMMPHPAGPVVLTPPGSNLSPAPAQKSTTLYIGKIATSVSEETIQTLLEACGPVKSWKPMQDPETNKSKGFGFCEYQDAEGVLRALRLLHNLALDGQELLLKCNTATQRYIDDYQANKQRQAEQKKQETKPTDDSSDSKPDVKAEQESTDDQQDDDILAKIMALVSDRAAQHASSTAADQATDFLKDVLPPPPSRERRPQPSSSKDRSYTSRERERGSSTERNAERQFERERQREKRELEIRQADLERAYQKKLREWEQVERLREKSEDQKKSDLRDADKARARAIRGDNEQGDADEDDEPWTRNTLHNSTSHAVDNRRRKRKQELKLDAADQEAEDAERAAARQKREEEDEVRASEDAARNDTEASFDIDTANGAHQEPDPNDPIYQAMMVAAKAPARSASPYQQTSPSPMDTADTAAPNKAPSRHPVAASTKGGWHTVFGGDEDQDAPQRRLVPLTYSEEEQKAAQAAATSTAAPAAVLDMDAEIDKVKKQIPRSMQTLATTPINWDAYDSAQPKMGVKVGKWVSGQIEKLLGQQEDTLLNFVQGELSKHSPPNTMLNELSPILDAEAEEFVLKLYQIVVFESSKFALSGQM